MKMRLSIFTVVIISSSLLILGFNKDKMIKDILGFVFIPNGSIEICNKTYTLDSYFIAEQEVTNREYNNFLNDLKINKKDSEFDIAKVHCENWRIQKQVDSFAILYNTALNYQNYPVVNISYDAAVLYCKWLTSKLNDKTHEYRLPSKIEWIYAARGGLELTRYSWGGKFLRNNKGDFMCNFYNIGDEFIHFDSDKKYEVRNFSEVLGRTHIPLPVNSFSSNGFGLFNMCGNVAEMIDEKGIALGGSWNSTGYDVRIESEMNYDESNIYVGFRPVRVKKM